MTTNRPPVNVIGDGPEDNEPGGFREMHSLDGWAFRERRLHYIGKPTRGELDLRKRRSGDYDVLWTGNANQVERALRPLNGFVQAMWVMRALTSGNRPQCKSKYKYKPINHYTDGTTQFFVCTIYDNTTEYSIGEDGALIWWDGRRKPSLEYEVQQHLVELTQPEPEPVKVKLVLPTKVKSVPVLPKRRCK